ncbi:MAG: sigma 54-interacting transcriptional regulator, partial [Bdellovibrionales bacterium]|nr:sigma 54-interacting transcriptional regulator [Bdellovibrionales bacterium]
MYLIRDLRSRNGTYVNGSRVHLAPLSNRDRVRVGQSDLVFLLERDHRPEKIVLTSKNPNWDQKLKALSEIAHSDLPILLGGASGTGKEIIAHQLHRHSPRREGPFVSVNCSALSLNLAESELFGHTKGSFTDATHDRKGAFETARGGTLFLDEIGDLPLELQPKLLR